MVRGIDPGGAYRRPVTPPKRRPAQRPAPLCARATARASERPRPPRRGGVAGAAPGRVDPSDTGYGHDEVVQELPVAEGCTQGDVCARGDHHRRHAGGPLGPQA